MNNKVLDLYRPKNETLNDAFDRLVVTIHHHNRMYDHKAFVLTGCEPKVGTTTIAINVAISLAMSGLKTILIDGDLRKEGKYKRLSDTFEQGLADVLRCNLDLASAICATNYQTLDYLPSGTEEENPVGLLYSPNLDKVIESLSGYYDYVIFDLPSANAAIDSNILASKVDAVVLVAKQHSTTTMQIKNAKNELDKIAANLIGIVFNNVDASEYRRYMKYYDYFNKELFIHNKDIQAKEEENDSTFELDYDNFKKEEGIENTVDFSLNNENIDVTYENEYTESIYETEYMKNPDIINETGYVENQDIIDESEYVENQDIIDEPEYVETQDIITGGEYEEEDNIVVDEKVEEEKNKDENINETK